MYSFYCVIYSYCYICSFLGSLSHTVVLCIVLVYMCAVLLPQGVTSIAVNKYITSYHIKIKIIKKLPKKSEDLTQ